MIPNLILLLQQANVEKKLKEAPDASYQIGVLIGSFVPVVLLIGMAYWMYYKAKKADKEK